MIYREVPLSSNANSSVVPLAIPQLGPRLSATEEIQGNMQYTPFASDIELPFYTALASLKINHDRLDDSARKVQGLYEIRPSDLPNVSSRMQIHGNALSSDE